MKRFFCAVLGTCASLACMCFAAPEPAIVPAPGQWTVNISFTHPQQLVPAITLDGQPERFWYTIITVTNNTGSDVDFYPKCELMTDNFKLIPAGKSVSPGIFQQIRQRHATRYPFLESLDMAGNRILEGEDNAKDIAVVWSDFGARAQSIRIFITGLSNETAVVPHPIAKNPDGEPLQFFFLRKTLELTYDLKSDAKLRSNAGLVFKGKRWIMR